MLTKKEYEHALPIKEKLKQLVKQDEYRLGFHIMPPTGWLNDPNGLCKYQGVNHLYFQYTPFTPTWGTKLWGHYTTQDWIHYREEVPFLFADSKDDQDGVYSGSAFIEKDEIHFFYTGNVKYTDGNYNYISNGREQNTIEVISKDGYTHHGKQLIFNNQDYPKDMSCHVRDPKIYKKNGLYYMVLGARTLQDTGCILLYQSDDLKTWQYHMRIETTTPFGYMWECPDLFDLDGKTYLVCCPQGIEQSGVDFANVYQCGYFEIKLDVINKQYELSSFVELDRGFDIYAPQTYEDETGRRILIAWMGIPDATYDNQVTVERGWQHALTMPRQLCVQEGKLVQKPLIEFQQLRSNKKSASVQGDVSMPVSQRYECKLDFSICQQLDLCLKTGINLHYGNDLLTLTLGQCGYGRDQRSVQLQALSALQIFVDSSSIEIFVNGGEEVFTSRYYTNQEAELQLSGNYCAQMEVFELGTFVVDELEAE